MKVIHICNLKKEKQEKFMLKILTVSLYIYVYTDNAYINTHTYFFPFKEY